MRSRRAELFWLAVLATIGLVVIAVALLVPRLHQLSQQSATLAKLESENRELRSEANQLAEERDRLLREQEELRAEPSPPTTVPAKLAPDDAATRLEQLRLLSETRERLAGANATIADLQARIMELEATADRTAEEKRSLAAAEEELKEKLADSTRIVDAMQTELKGYSDRLVKLEIRNQALQKKSHEATEQSTQAAHLAAQLEDLHRRQEVFLSGILRRYRDITDLYRTLALRLDNPSEDAEPSSVNLSRIRSAINMADEDLRQLRALNAQAERIRKKLSQ
jgi:chromosome segregation ATPase